MKVASLFSGVGTFDKGFQDAGWETVGLCEFDPKARQVLAARFPGVPINHDITTLRGMEFGPADVVMGGFPCQDLSLAGKRGGMTEGSGTRSSLFFEAVRYVKEMREHTGNAFPRFVLVENVPGLLNSNGGRDFAAVLRALLDLGARDVSWRVLDSRFFGVPQRRRRVFLVADFGGECAAEVLFEPKGVRGHPAAGRGPAEGAASAASQRPGISGTERMIPQSAFDPARPLLSKSGWRGDGESDNFVVEPVLSFQQNSMDGKGTLGVDLDTRTLRPVKPQSDHQMIGLPPRYAVRRLTPEECEALQAMPRGWTDVDGMTDSHRYRFMGNGGTSTVLKWLAERMARVLA